MPKPIPGYLSGPIRDVLAKYPAGIKGLAEKLGANYGSLLNTFKRGPNRSLYRFIDSANYLGISTDELLELLEYQPGDQRKRALESMLGLTGETTLKDVLKDEPAIQGYVYGLLRGQSGSTIASLYKPLAKEFRMDLEHMCRELETSR
jgi:hypothetical protein